MTQPRFDAQVLVDGKSEKSERFTDIIDKYHQTSVGRVFFASEDQIQRALEGVSRSQDVLKRKSLAERRELLLTISRVILEKKGPLSQLLVAEVGKTLSEALIEVERASDTFSLMAGELGHLSGETVSSDLQIRGRGLAGFWKRVPVGVCALIIPFNFPLNLAAHKIAPAIAAGCPFVVKPSSVAPLATAALVDILLECGAEPSSFAFLPCERIHIPLITQHPCVRLISFTGSSEVGWKLKAESGKKRVLLELGGNAAVVVLKDANLEAASKKIVLGAFRQAGQSCISVQRVFVEKSIFNPFTSLLVEETKKLKMGDPHQLDTDIGPMISVKEAERIETWVDKAKRGYAKVLVGGDRNGVFFQPTILVDVPASSELISEEAFGPVMVVETIDCWEAAVEKVNQSRYGLQAGLFTQDLSKAFSAWDHLEVGGVMVNEVPTFRLDHAPYGGVKDSGQGREGVRFSMEEMTEIRALGIRWES